MRTDADDDADGAGGDRAQIADASTLTCTLLLDELRKVILNILLGIVKFYWIYTSISVNTLSF